MNRIFFLLSTIIFAVAALPEISSAQTSKEWNYPPGGCPRGGELLEPFRTDDPRTPQYYFPPAPAEGSRPAVPLAITLWRVDCGNNLGTSELRMRLSRAVGQSAWRPHLTIVQDGVVHGCTGPEYSGDPAKAYVRECRGLTGLGRQAPYVGPICPPFHHYCTTEERYHAYMTDFFGTQFLTLSLEARVTTFDPDRAFSLHVRGNWAVSVPDAVYEIPAKAGAGSGAILPTWLAGQWWNPKEPGWGLILDRNERGAMFAAWLTYDDNGDTTWYVMTDSRQDEPGSVTGNVHALRGQPFATPNAESTLAGEIVGKFHFSFPAPTHGEAILGYEPLRARQGEFSYTVNGRSGTSPIELLDIRGTSGKNCTFFPNVLQVNGLLGWAAHIEGGIQAGCYFHATFLTYDRQNKPMWVFGGLKYGSNVVGAGELWSVDGTLHRPRGTPYGRPYDASRLVIGPPVGSWKSSRIEPYALGLQQVEIDIDGAGRKLDFERFRFEY